MSAAMAHDYWLNLLPGVYYICINIYRYSKYYMCLWLCTLHLSRTFLAQIFNILLSSFQVSYISTLHLYAKLTSLDCILLSMFQSNSIVLFCHLCVPYQLQTDTISGQPAHNRRQYPPLSLRHAHDRLCPPPHTSSRRRHGEGAVLLEWARPVLLQWTCPVPASSVGWGGDGGGGPRCQSC